VARRAMARKIGTNNTLEQRPVEWCNSGGAAPA
jgi:hypothetical protein